MTSSIENEENESPELRNFKKEKAIRAKELGNEAFRKRKWREAITHYAMAVEYSWTDPEVKFKIYSNRALAYHREGRPELAADDAQKCIALKPDWGKVGLRIVEHATAMGCLLGVHERNPQNYIKLLENERYTKEWETAVSRVAKETKDGIVLYLGSGTGLMPMVAYKAGADFVVSCERWKYMAESQKETVKRNGFDLVEEISVVHKRATELILGEDCGDVPERANIFISELFDEGLLGLGHLPALHYAREELLLKSAKVVPMAATMFGQIIEMRTTMVEGFDFTEFNKYRWNAIYEPIHLKENEYRPLSEVFEVFHFDFLGERIDTRQRPIKIVPTADGTMNAVVFWYTMQLDAETSYSTAPDGVGLRQALQYVEEQRVFEGEYVHLRANHTTTRVSFELLKGSGSVPQSEVSSESESELSETDLEEEGEVIMSDEEYAKFQRRVKRWLPPGQRAAVGRWQFGMLADRRRSAAYAKAIHRAVALSDESHVLDVGSGGGLLALLAARGGAQRITAVEQVRHVAAAAQRVVALNGYHDNITVVPKHSTRLLPKDLPGSPPNLLVAEIFDYGLLGEGCLPALHHAHSLLDTQSPPRCIPASASFYAVLLELPSHQDVLGFDLSELNHFRNTKDYVGVDLTKVPHRYLSNVFQVFDFNFEDASQHRQVGERELEVEVTEDGQICAIACWFTLQLDRRTELSTAPDSSQAPDSSEGHWQQALFWLPVSVPVTSGQRVELVASHSAQAVQFALAGDTPGLEERRAVPKAEWTMEFGALEERLEQHANHLCRMLTPADFRMVYLLTQQASDYGGDPEEVFNFLLNINYGYQLPHEDDIPEELKKIGRF